MAENPKKHYLFDLSFNLKHVISIAPIIAAVAFGWFSLDKRVVVLEQQRKLQEIRDEAQDDRQDAQNQFLRENYNQIKGAIDRLDDKVDKILGQ